MIETIDKTLPVYTSEQLRSMVATLSKNGSNKIAESEEILKTISSIASFVISDKDSLNKYYSYVGDLFILAAKVLVGMQGLSAQHCDLIDSTLFLISQACCLCFAKQNYLPAGDVLLVISDSKKSLYYQSSSKEEIVVTVTNPAGYLSKNNLEPIKQIPDEFSSICQADLLMAETLYKTNHITVKRQNIRQGYVKIAQSIIKGLEGCQKQFKDRSPEWLNKYLQIIVKLMKIMTTQYLIEIFKSIRDKVWEYYTKADQNVIRNVTKELLQAMFLTVQQIFIRLEIEQDKNKWLEHLIVEITLPLIRCQLLKKKIIGTKYLSDICNQVYNSRTKYLKDSEFKVWLANNRVFEELFTLDTHDQIMQAGGDILRYIVRSNSLTNEQLYTILNIVEKGDANLRRIVSKIMYDLTLRYDYNQTEIILNQYNKYPPSIFNEEMIKIISDTSRYSIQRHRLLGIDIFEKLITQYYEQFKPSIQEELISKYVQLMKCILERSTSDTNCLIYFQRLINIPLETHIIQLLKKLLDLFPESRSETKFYQYNNTNYEIVKHLIESAKLHNRLIEIINSTGDAKRKQSCLEFLVSIIKVYKDNSLEQKYLSLDILQKLTNYSKIFCQLLYSFRTENFEELFTLLVSQPVSNMEHLLCLKQLFYYINKSNMIKIVSDNSENSYQVSVLPDKLNGFKDFMNATLDAQKLSVRQEAASFICQMYCNLSPQLSEQKDRIIKEFVESLLESIRTLHNNKGQSKQSLGCLCLIEGMMNQTQTKGVGTLTAHSSLVNMQSIKITITNQITYGYGIEKNYQSKFPSNLTLFQLLVQVGKIFKCSAQDIIVKYNDFQIKSIYNGLSLHQLNLKDKVLNAQKRARQSISRVQMLDLYNKLTEPAIKAFTGIFHRFATNGQMSMSDSARFVEASTNDSCSIQDYRVVDLFYKYDTNKDGVLDLEDFLNFFEDSCKSRESTVWRNLESLRIRPDLKRYEDVKENLDYNIMARYIVYESDIYDILFEMTLNENLKEKAIQLLKRLPTSKRIIKETLQNINFEQKDEFISWYKLTLIEWMIHQNVDKKQDNKQMLLNQESNKQSPIKASNQSPQKQKQNQFWIHQETEMKQIKFARSQSSKSKRNDQQVEFEVLNQPDIAHIDSSKINQWKERFLSNKMYIKIYEQAESIAQTPLKQMSSISKNCLLLCLQIIRRLCKVPELQKPLPSTSDFIPEITLIDLPHNRLSEALIPQLFQGQMNTQLLEPLLCLLFNNLNIDFKMIYPGLFHQEKEVRILTTNFLYFYERINNYNIDLFAVEPKEECQEFFTIVNKVLIEDDKINLQELFTKTYNEIENHVIKQEIGNKQPDYLFQGKLSILNNILVILPKLHITPAIQHVLIQKLHRSLFPSTRSTLYNLLLKTDLTGLFKYLSNFVQSVQPKKPSSIRNHFVGLYNLGCTCYMNAMLQQFYMTPEFRYAILGIENPNIISVSQKKGKKFKDNVLHQIQRMFAFLELSHRGDYSPEHFCYSYKSDINFGIQEDSQQFLGIVFSKIQHQLKNTQFSDLVDKVYGGKTIMTIKCSKCLKQKYRVQDFNNLQLEVKQRKNLDESLSRFSQEETINDFKCQFCLEEGIIRSTSLYQLPNILIVHLMRMVFDVETYERIKLHNKLQFPTELNLLKHMKVQQGQSLPQHADCDYVLKGVVIHSGCAESGHYYSLIKDSNEWYKFDDSRVTHFNMNDIGDQAFGGRQEYNDWGSTGSTRSKNAYMLIYEKRTKSEWILKKPMTEEEKERMKPFIDVQEVISETQHVKAQQEKQYRIKKFKRSIRRDLEQEIVNDHKVMFHEIQFYQDGFFRFLKNVIEKMLIKKQFFNEIMSKQAKAYTQLSDIMTAEQTEQYTQLLLFLLKMMEFFTKMPNPDITIVKTMIPYIDILLFILPQQAENFIMNIDTQKYFEILITHSDSPIRDLHRSILNRCFNIILQKRDVNLNQPLDQSIYKTKLVSILEGLLGLLYTQVPKNSAKLHQYFEFWRIFSISTKECMKYCFNKNFISLFIDFLLQKKSPIMLNPGNYSLPKYSNPPIESLLQMLAALLSRSTSNKEQVVEQSQDSFMYVLTENDKKCLTHIPFYNMMIEQKQDFTGIILILNQLVRNNFSFSLGVAVFLMKGINKSERYESALAYMMIINGYLAVEDSYQRQRLEWILGVPQLIESSHNQYSIKQSIRNQTVRYLSSLFAGQGESYKSVLELLYSQRRNPDSFSVTGVSILLNLLSSSKAILEYVLELPPPCHVYGFYVHWIPHFIDTFQKDRTIILPDDKDKMAEKCFANLIEIHKGMEAMITSARDREMAEKMLREQEEAERKQWQDDEGINQFYQTQKVQEVQKQQQKEEQKQKQEQIETVTQQTEIEKIPLQNQLDSQKIQIPLQKNESDNQETINVPLAADLKKSNPEQTNPPNQQQDLYTFSSVVIESSESKPWYQDNTDPILSTAQIPQNSTVLPSLRSLFIIGVSQKVQAAGTYTVEENQKQVKLTELILHTYVLESKPTGEDNLALPKDLFQHQYNFRLKPLKYFVESDTKYLTSFGQAGVPEIRPTVIHIKIETNSNILVTSKNPDFRYSFYYTRGIHHLNIPYVPKEIDQLIEISFNNYHIEEESEKREQASQSNTQFVGPLLKQSYYEGPSAGNWDQNDFLKEVACGACTYVNTRGSISCELCHTALDFI